MGAGGSGGAGQVCQAAGGQVWGGQETTAGNRGSSMEGIMALLKLQGLKRTINPPLERRSVVLLLCCICMSNLLKSYIIVVAQLDFLFLSWCSKKICNWDSSF